MKKKTTDANVIVSRMMSMFRSKIKSAFNAWILRKLLVKNS